MKENKQIRTLRGFDLFWKEMLFSQEVHEAELGMRQILEKRLADELGQQYACVRGEERTKEAGTCVYERRYEVAALQEG